MRGIFFVAAVAAVGSAVGIHCAARAGEGVEQNLRFYGRVSSEAKPLKGGVSDFVVTAESEEKAKLWQAKFLSDLVCEGVAAKRCSAAGGTENLYEVPGGWMAAMRIGHRVHLLHAPTAEAIRAVQGTHGVPCAEVEVPMAMDAFEKYAFRFYYRLGMKPEGASFYDEAENIEFCRTNELGLVFWTGPHWADAAAGVLSDGQWGYLLDRARRGNVPVGLNFRMSKFPARDFFAADMDTRQPGFMGGFVRFGGPHYGGAGHLSVDHPAANAHSYAGIQEILRRYDTENVVSLHEVNGELRHGAYNIFLNYGPEADRSFRSFLRERYGRDFPNAHYPEVAEFAGYGPKAQDLAGTWRIRYEDAEEGAWGTTPAMPGDDRTLFLPRKPATLERDFDYRGTGRTWLYLWDLNYVHNGLVEIALNGQVVRHEAIRFNTYHWTYVEVTDALKRGRNTLSLKLPWGIIGYKVYLTHEEPRFFPFASPEKNRLWVDSIDWNTARRLRTITDSMNAMRAVDPDKSAVLMNPRAYSRQMREIARLRGGRFHDTGGMGVCIEESEPMLMRGANLPFTLEPGSPAKDLRGFRHLVGIWMAQGINAIHYYIHVGDVLWHPDIKAEFLRVLPALKMIGKSRQKQGDVAMVIDSDVDKYFGYPWCDGDFNIAFPSGYWPWRFSSTLPRYPMDALIPEDFSNGLADRYKVVIDCNNAIISRAGVAAIRKWVERGGTYLAMFQSGRHSFEGADKWELQSLTGFRGKVFVRYQPSGAIEPSSRDVMLRTPEGASRLPTLADAKVATGTSLEAVAEDVETLATWKTAGGAAIGYRKVGHGEVYTFGVQLSKKGQGHGVWFPELVEAIFKSRGVMTMGFTNVGKGRLNCKHFVSNNGLYDVWYAWNDDGHEGTSVDYEFTFDDGRPREVRDVLTGEILPLKGTIPSFGFVIGVSPRLDTRDAAAHWFDRQCGDNQGTLVEAFAEPKDGYGANTYDLSDGWTVNGVPGVRLGVWEKGVQPGVLSNRVVATRRFEVPSAWKDGTVYLSHVGMYDSGVFNLSAKRRPDEGLRVFLDSEPRNEKPSDRGFSLAKLPKLEAGSSHELRFELTTSPEGRFTGTRGATFLSFVPTPKRTFPLGTGWTGEGQFLNLAADLSFLRLKTGERVFFHQDGAKGVEGVLVNGKYVRRHHHLYGEVVNIDVTDFLKSGKNELVLVTRGWKVDYPPPELHVK